MGVSDVIPFIVNIYTRRRKMPIICTHLCWLLPERRDHIRYLNRDNVEISETFYFADVGESSRAGREGEAQMAVLKPWENLGLQRKSC